MFLEVFGLLSNRYRERNLGNYSDPLDKLVFICLSRQTHQKNAARSCQVLQSLEGLYALERPEKALVAALQSRCSAEVFS